jgi:hypothetical protein
MSTAASDDDDDDLFAIPGAFVQPSARRREAPEIALESREDELPDPKDVRATPFPFQMPAFGLKVSLRTMHLLSLHAIRPSACATLGLQAARLPSASPLLSPRRSVPRSP